MHVGAEARRLVAPMLAAALVAVPLLSLGQVFERGIRLEAVAIVGLLGLGWLASGRHPLRWDVGGLPRNVLWALGGWAAAALWGAGVGLVSGNPLRNVLSQTLAMLLLPLGAFVFARFRGFSVRQLTAGLVFGSLTAVTVRGITAEAGLLDDRLRIGGASLADAGTLLLLLGAGLALTRGSRLLGWCAVGLGAVVVAAGLARGQWLTAGGALVVLVLLRLPVARRRTILLVVGVLAVAVGVLLIWRVRGHLEPRKVVGAAAGKPAVEAMAGASGIPIATFELHETAAFEVTGRMHAALDDRCTLWAVARNPQGIEVARSVATVVGSGSAVPFTVVFERQAKASAMHIGLTARRGRCRLETAQIDAIDHATLAWFRSLTGLPVTVERMGEDPARGLVATLTQRVRRLASALRAPEGDVTIGYRLAEQRALFEAWRAASPVRLALGHGLGATIPFTNRSWDAQGRVVMVPEASYLHNAYTALAFKLGAMALVAFGAIVAVLLATWRAGRGPAPEVAAAAATACWIAYLAWSLISPQLLNFRIAPLLGALLAATFAERR